jgi:hypothetical protein
MVNEVPCKILCHNLVVLIHEMYELEIAPCSGKRQRSTKSRTYIRGRVLDLLLFV